MAKARHEFATFEDGRSLTSTACREDLVPLAGDGIYDRKVLRVAPAFIEPSAAPPASNARV
jgi:hypothetical protein